MKKYGRSLIPGSLPFKKVVVVSLLINLITIGTTLVFQNNLPPEIPLFYGKPRGIEQLSQKTYLVIPPSIALVIAIINIIFVHIISDKFLQKLLSGIILIISIMAAYSVYKTFSLVGNF